MGITMTVSDEQLCKLDTFNVHYYYQYRDGNYNIIYFDLFEDMNYALKIISQ